MRRLTDVNWQQGFAGESTIALWLRSRGYTVIPAYEKQSDDWKGPRVFLPTGELVAPDMFAMITRNGTTYAMWVEAKTKGHFSWHYTTAQWQTGVDVRYFEQYQQLQRIHTLPVWMLFLHLNTSPRPGDIEKGCPAECPAGLFGQRLDVLLNNGQAGGARGFYDRRGKYHPMVYWNVSNLFRYASPVQLARLEERGQPQSAS